MYRTKPRLILLLSLLLAAPLMAGPTGPRVDLTVVSEGTDAEGVYYALYEDGSFFVSVPLRQVEGEVGSCGPTRTLEPEETTRRVLLAVERPRHRLSRLALASTRCGACASAPSLCIGSGGYASCCVSADQSETVGHLGRTTQRSYWQKSRTIYPGDAGTLENRVSVKAGGRENCNGGADDGWHFGYSSQYEPDRDVSTTTKGTYATYNWTGGGATPIIYGSGFSYYCGVLPDCDPSQEICPE